MRGVKSESRHTLLEARNVGGGDTSIVKIIHMSIMGA